MLPGDIFIVKSPVDDDDIFTFVVIDAEREIEFWRGFMFGAGAQYSDRIFEVIS